LALYTGLTLLGIVMVFPFVWMISTSFKQPADIYTLSLLPAHPTLNNYVIALTGFPFARWFANSPHRGRCDHAQRRILRFADRLRAGQAGVPVQDGHFRCHLVAR